MCERRKKLSRKAKESKQVGEEDALPRPAPSCFSLNVNRRRGPFSRRDSQRGVAMEHALFIGMV